MADLEAGAAQFKILAEHLRVAGEGGLRRELDKAISDAAGPLKDQIRAGLPDHLPDPYAAVLNADLRLSVSKRAATDNPGIRIQATTPGIRRRLKRLEDGVLAHPLYGNRRHWYDQTSHVRPGWFAGPAGDSAPKVREAILSAMHRLADQAARKV